MTTFSLIDMGIYEISGGGRNGRLLQNRIGKTFTMAYGAWLAEEAGMDVWCNCPSNPRTGEPEHILNIPHYDFDPYRDRCHVSGQEPEQFHLPGEEAGHRVQI